MKRIGVLGTFVWDEIWHPAGDAGRPLEQLGGVAYSLAAFAAACPQGWGIAPLVRVGSDLASPIFDFIAALPNIGSRAGLKVVPEPNNRVELRYHDDAERTERLTGGVSGWPAEELLPLVLGLDALYVNFLAGNEIDLQTALALRAALQIPIYTDLHSLFLGPVGVGPRRPRRLRNWAEWLRYSDVVQLNETELKLLGPERTTAMSLLRALPAMGPAVVLVTRGGRGASFARRSGWSIIADRAVDRVTAKPDDPIELGEVPLSGVPLSGDPTGCGDVWGSVVFSGLLQGHSLEDAMRRAHRASAANIEAGSIDRLSARIVASLRSGDEG